MKNIRVFFLSENFLLVVNFSVYLNRRVFVMIKLTGAGKLWRIQKAFCGEEIANKRPMGHNTH